MKTKVIIYQLGSPKSTAPKDVRSYLREFLSDKRVIDTPRVIWFFILNLFILPFRPKKVSKLYKRIEFCGFFPLIEITKSFTRKLQGRLADKVVTHSFVLSEPRLKDVIGDYSKGQKIVFLPQFPQFSYSTTASCLDQLEKIIPDYKVNKDILILESYHRSKAFIDNSIDQIKKTYEKNPADIMLLSFHGLPKRYISQRNDPYLAHCIETYLLIKKGLQELKVPVEICFQSRLGGEPWLSPYTDEYTKKLMETHKTILVYCPSFVVDCLETTDEIGNELAEEIEELGGELVFVPSLNSHSNWIDAYANLVESFIENGQEGVESLSYQIDENEVNSIKDKIMNTENESKPLDVKAKKTIKIIFLTLFLDLVGFSIIFPMFPEMAKYYLSVDSDNYFLTQIFSMISSFSSESMNSMNTIVLFGGFLGALYSLLQFFAAPIWGGLSDRFGRKPILLISVFGLFLSYIIWMFSGSFTYLLIARFVGGIMGGNLSAATAAVADVTDKSNRSKGMAFVGIAFALGFIFGPAFGGILTMFNPLDYFSTLSIYGINPFSFAALLAAILSFINLVIISFKFEETLVSDKSEEKNLRSANIFKLLKPLPYKNVNLTNYGYFLFITAFSGMEFTLTFLAVERLSYTSMDNAYMFIFIGFLIAMTQGGYVRRKANIVGEKKMAIMGLFITIPGLLIISQANSSFLLYVGLFFLSIGSAMSIPTLTSLVSLHTPDKDQGHSLGIFRSLGSLGRVLGPIIASLIYWKYGSSVPYLLGSIFLVFPILILKKVEQKSYQD